MDAYQSAVSGCLRDEIKHHAVVHHHLLPGIDHIHLEGGQPQGDDIPDLLQDLIVQLLQAAVKAEVNNDPPIQRLLDSLLGKGDGHPALICNGEIQHGRRPAAGCGNRTGIKIIAAGTALEGVLVVGMGVDPAGDHIFPCSIDFPGAPDVSEEANSGDFAVLDSYIRNLPPTVGDNGPVPDDQIHSWPSF